MITYGTSYYPMWKRGGFCFHENGGRKDHECLDMSLIIGKRIFNMTIWNLGKSAKIIRYIPRAKGGRGFCIGFLPVGQEL